ncbi:MAG: radical SAM protein [Candidatus Aminicenantes bacterium]|nr:radical SAM protein [Candidatus Aminicenantes bacterium]
MIKITEVRAKSILNKSKIFDYCVNCYTGCQVNCRYCYARLFIPRYSGHSEPWGSFVDVKVNAPEVLAKQVLRAKKGIVWLSSVCDCYQPLEAKYKLTRQCLEILAEHRFPVQVQSKSILLLRDQDIFKKFETVEVGFTITTDDERIARLFEPGASPVSERIQALGILKSNGIRTFAFVGPILPGNPEKLVALLEGKIDKVLIDRMNYLDTVKKFYLQQNLGYAMSNDFFANQTRRLVEELKKKGTNFDVVS